MAEKLPSTRLARTEQFKPQLSGLALIERLYFGAGPQVAENLFRQLLGQEHSVRSFTLCETGQPSVGVDTVSSDEISYESFSPPAYWNAEYSLQRVYFGHNAKSDFLFHGGEEILIPVKGNVAYHFFWTPGRKAPERMLLVPAAGAGSVLRINPQVPHHAWGVDGDAVAWSILRHTTNSPVALVRDQNLHSLVFGSSGIPNFVANHHGHHSLRRMSTEDLRKPGVYAMIAWGVSEFIREARHQAGLSTIDLARRVGVDPSSLSRLEEAKANVSIEMLGKVCGALRIGLAERMDSGSWTHELRSFDVKMDAPDEHLLKPPRGAHFLHPWLLRFAQGAGRKLPTWRGTERNQISSWIVLKGRLVLEVPQLRGEKSVVLSEGTVMHFREHGEVAVLALQDSIVVQVIYSQICECK